MGSLSFRGESLSVAGGGSFLLDDQFLAPAIWPFFLQRVKKSVHVPLLAPLGVNNHIQLGLLPPLEASRRRLAWQTADEAWCGPLSFHVCRQREAPNITAQNNVICSIFFTTPYRMDCLMIHSRS